ncbi:ABC transporter permease [Gemmatimonas sp.]|uniref:ABC transporter permease n=1 Tax=Gemmatimonas sp. TaxID=1962908 RepID=UPI00286AB8A0|nr:ABC transporter permease [Gemmatimonas sp.]
MLSPRWRKALGDLRQHGGRTALVVVAIATGLAAAGTILNAWALVQVATKDGYLASDPAAATIRVDAVDDAMLSLARAVPGVRDVQARRTTMARAQVAGATVTAMLFTVDPREAVRIGAVTWESGAPPTDGTLTVERSSLDFSGVVVGDEVILSVGDAPPAAVTVRAVARDVGLAPGWMEHVLYGFVSPATLTQLGAPNVLNELRVVFDDGSLDQAGVRALAFRLRAAIEATGHMVRDVDVPVPGEHIHAAQMDSLLYTQFAFAVLAMVLSAFLVVNLVTAMLVGQTREIGVMKALGARPHQLALMYLAVAAALGIAAAALAVPIGLIAGREYAGLKAEMLNFDLSGYAVPWWVIALEVGVAVLLPVIAAAVPVWRGCRVPVNDALRDVGIVGAGLGARALRVRGLPRPLLLALRNTFRRTQRTLLTLGTLSLGGAVYLGATNLRAAVLGVTDAIFAANHYDFTLRLAVPGNADSLEAIARAVNGVAGVEAWTAVRASLDHGDGTVGNTFVITAPPAATRLLQPEIEEGRWLRADDQRALVIGRALQRAEPQLRVGMQVPLMVNGAVARWTIVGVASGGPSVSAYASRQVVGDLLGVRGAGSGSSLVVKSAYEGEASRLDLIARLRTALAERGQVVSASTMLSEAKRGVDDHLLMVVSFLGVMGWVMILVGGLALASTMGLAVLERTREIGVLRAIGARHGSIFALVQVEGLTIALLSWLAAIPLSIPMSLALGAAFSRIMLPVPARYAPDTSGVIIWLGLVTIVSMAACAWPAMRAMRVPTAAALAYE